jgi:hypothetical protein
MTASKSRTCCRKARRGRAGIPVTRTSCLECVEKHLGAAWVLLAEHRDGYATRLRAIGHLFEAEDESQVWPDLHDAIRAARRAYQLADTMPDWEALAELAARAAETSSATR